VNSGLDLMLYEAPVLYLRIVDWILCYMEHLYCSCEQWIGSYVIWNTCIVAVNSGLDLMLYGTPVL